MTWILENSGQNNISFLLSAGISPRGITGIFDKHDNYQQNKLLCNSPLLKKSIDLKKGENNPILLDVPLKNK